MYDEKEPTTKALDALKNHASKLSIELERSAEIHNMSASEKKGYRDQVNSVLRGMINRVEAKARDFNGSEQAEYSAMEALHSAFEPGNPEYTV